MRLIVEGLACVRAARSVFAGVSFSVAPGDALAVTGRNGAGKSSLLRVLAGLVPAAGGRISLEGGSAEATLAEEAHYLGHQDPARPSLTVAENLDFWIRYLGGDAAAGRAGLAAVGLETLADVPAGYLSAGQRRRLSIARLVAVVRPVWLLDEPTSVLDAAAREVLAGLMAAHRAGGGLIVAATHVPLGLAPALELRLADGSASLVGGAAA